MLSNRLPRYILCTIAVLVFSAFSVSCGDNQGEDANSNLNIVGGVVLKNNETSELFLSSVGITDNELNARGKTFCSAVIITNKVLLTAAHCVEKYREQHTHNLYAVFGNKKLYNPYGRAVPDIEIQGIAIHSGYKKILDRGELEKVAANDLALLYLRTEISAPFKPIEFLNIQNKISEFSHIVLAGYGVTGGFTSDDSGVIRAVDVTKKFENFDAKTIELEGPVLEGKRIDENGDGSYDYKKATGGSCNGDSGGPAYVWDSGNFKLLGITAFGDSQRLARNPNGPSYCVGGSFVTDLRYYSSYVLRAAREIENKKQRYGHKFIISF